MIGYRARHAAGELVLQKSEIRDARWFTPAEIDTVTAVRGPFSIAGRLIDGWIAEQATRAA
jgi:NADH pyrophosphatase NudC (nudix superfamily)